MEKISVKDRLPEENQYVLAHVTLTNWGDKDDPTGNRYWKVVKFTRGISMMEREQMKIDSPEIPESHPSIPNMLVYRSRAYSFHNADEHGNNKVPYKWDEFGPGGYFGQDVDYWCELPC